MICCLQKGQTIAFYQLNAHVSDNRMMLKARAKTQTALLFSLIFFFIIIVIHCLSECSPQKVNISWWSPQNCPHYMQRTINSMKFGSMHLYCNITTMLRSKCIKNIDNSQDATSLSSSSSSCSSFCFHLIDFIYATNNRKQNRTKHRFTSDLKYK